MKTCTYCGAEYSDDMSRCPIDEAPVVEQPTSAIIHEAHCGVVQTNKGLGDALQIRRMIEALTFRRVAMVLLIAIAAWLGVQLMRERRDARTCIDELIDIDYIKHVWAESFGKDSNAVPTWDDLAPFMDSRWVHSPGHSTFTPPTCPFGGTYTIGRVGDLASCSFPHHSIALSSVIVYVSDSTTNSNGGEVWPTHETRVLVPDGMGGAKVVVLNENGHHLNAVTDSQGRAVVDPWPNKPVAVIVSKRGFLTSSNPVSIDTIRGGLNIRLQRQMQ